MGSGGRRTPRRLLRLAVALGFAALPVLTGGATAQAINEARTLHEGDYLFVGMAGWQGNVDWIIDVNWSASRTVDAYLLNVHQFHDFENWTTYSYLELLESNSGSIHYTVHGGHDNDLPYYFVMDYSSRGPSDPTTPGGNTTADVTVNGRTWLPEGPSVSYTAAPGADVLVMAITGTVVAIPFVILGVVLLRRRKNTKRLDRIRADLRAGKIVGATPPPPPPPPPRPPPPPVAPVFVPAPGEPPLPMPTLAAYKASCTSCGKPLKERAKFCGHCGRMA